jgi:HAD superfamily hydrolase (TIGR01484 family)
MPGGIKESFPQQEGNKMSSENEIIHSIEEIISRNPQLFLDYDGTLVPIIKDPQKNQSDGELVKLISLLNFKLEIYIITGREVGDILNFLGEYNIIGLHGSVFHFSGETIYIPQFSTYVALFNKIYLNIEYLQQKFHGLRIYNKTGSILFHLGNIKNQELSSIIYKIASFLAMRYNVELYSGIDIIELRIPDVNKGVAINHIRNKNRPAIIIGDDRTDEDSFIKNPDAITIKVGQGETHARYVIGYQSVRPLLWKLAKIL